MNIQRAIASGTRDLLYTYIAGGGAGIGVGALTHKAETAARSRRRVWNDPENAATGERQGFHALAFRSRPRLIHLYIYTCNSTTYACTHIHSWLAQESCRGETLHGEAKLLVRNYVRRIYTAPKNFELGASSSCTCSAILYTFCAAALCCIPIYMAIYRKLLPCGGRFALALIYLCMQMVVRARARRLSCGIYTHSSSATVPRLCSVLHV